MLRVLVTGAAGLIGGEVCARLVENGHSVTAMVHRTPDIRDNHGRDVAVARVVTGDVTAPLMGLEPALFDFVIHCAACLEFDASEERLTAINVDGTRNALAYARQAGARFLHVSTAYVSGTSDGVIEEGPVPGTTRFTNRYEASKARAEAAVARSGVPFAIARPSIVLGDSTSGAIRDFPSLCNVFRLMARGKVTRFPAAPSATLDLVPIDHVAAGIVAIAQKMEASAGGYFHLVADSPMPAAELAHGVARVAHFPDPEVVPPADYVPEGVLAQHMIETFGAYFTRAPQFDDAKFRALTGLSCPPTDRAWLDRLIAHGIARGYLPAPPVSERPDNLHQAVRARQAPILYRP